MFHSSFKQQKREIFSLFLGWQLSKLQKSGLLWFWVCSSSPWWSHRCWSLVGGGVPEYGSLGGGFWVRRGRWLDLDEGRGGGTQRNRQKKQNSAAAPIHTRSLSSWGRGNIKKSKIHVCNDGKLAICNLKWSRAILSFIYCPIFFQEEFGSTFCCSLPAEEV